LKEFVDNLRNQNTSLTTQNSAWELQHEAQESTISSLQTQLDTMKEQADLDKMCHEREVSSLNTLLSSKSTEEDERMSVLNREMSQSHKLRDELENKISEVNSQLDQQKMKRSLAKNEVVGLAQALESAQTSHSTLTAKVNHHLIPLAQDFLSEVYTLIRKVELLVEMVSGTKLNQLRSKTSKFAHDKMGRRRRNSRRGFLEEGMSDEDEESIGRSRSIGSDEFSVGSDDQIIYDRSHPESTLKSEVEMYSLPSVTPEEWTEPSPSSSSGSSRRSHSNFAFVMDDDCGLGILMGKLNQINSEMTYLSSLVSRLEEVIGVETHCWRTVSQSTSVFCTTLWGWLGLVQNSDASTNQPSSSSSISRSRSHRGYELADEESFSEQDF